MVQLDFIRNKTYAGDHLKSLILLFSFIQLNNANASLIAVMDTGTDLSHLDFSSKVWFNKNEKAGSSIDLDSDGFAGDINGWDYTSNSSVLFDPKYQSLITEDVKKFFNYYGKYDLGLLNGLSPELNWLTDNFDNQELIDKVNFLGSYIHGTHVSGISVGGNNHAKLLTMKVIPSEYEDQHSPETEVKKTERSNSLKTIDQYKNELIDDANEQVKQMIELNNYVHFHHVDVVNQSFGIGHTDAEDFIKAEFVNNFDRYPTQLELALLIKIYFDHLLTEGRKMFKMAPQTLFVIAAGNDTSNNDLFPDFPSNVEAPNKIVVTATLGFRKLADFSNFGMSKVDVAAPGVGITSSAPTNTYIALSGTSQAAPYVTNTISLIKDLNPNLAAIEIKEIILRTVDVKDWLKRKVRSSGIVNRERALKAAELTNTQSLDTAILNSHLLVQDVLTSKSFLKENRKLKIKFKPFRPSLIIKRMYTANSSLFK